LLDLASDLRVRAGARVTLPGHDSMFVHLMREAADRTRFCVAASLAREFVGFVLSIDMASSPSSP
jgi:hypothetical protein